MCHTLEYDFIYDIVHCTPYNLHHPVFYATENKNNVLLISCK